MVKQTALATITALADLSGDNLTARARDALHGHYDDFGGLYRLYMDEHYYLLRELHRRLSDVPLHCDDSPAHAPRPDIENGIEAPWCHTA